MKFSFRRKKNNDFLKTKAYIRKKYFLHSRDIRCNTEKGLISVILPVYNCGKYLEESVKSVLSQTYTNLELIIVERPEGERLLFFVVVERLCINGNSCFSL